MDIQFTEHFVLLNGNNGSGKTNLIDAVHYLCLCKSYFTRHDAHIILHTENFFRLDGEFSQGDTTIIITGKYYPDKRKEFFKNEVVYERLSEHIGELPVVLIAPGDVDIIYGGSEERRKFLDAAIGQFDKTYLQKLIEYNKIVSQRNFLLRQFSEEGRRGSAVLEVLNMQLAERGEFIFRERKKFIETYTHDFEKMYRSFSSGKEIPSVQYSSQLEGNNLLQLLIQNTEKDIAAQRTTAGIHKDDLLFQIEGFPLREHASQGQMKSFLISLKLVLSRKFFENTRKKPILLLDDIFEKLDMQRLHVLFSVLKDEIYEQIFITDADENRSVLYMKSANIKFQHIRIFEGEVMGTEG